SSRRRHTSSKRDWSSDVCSSDLIFQPELRRALEQLGRKNFFRAFLFSSDEESGEKSFLTEKAVNEIVRAAFEMSKVKTGALIVRSEERRVGKSRDGRGRMELDAW